MGPLAGNERSISTGSRLRNSGGQGTEGVLTRRDRLPSLASPATILLGPMLSTRYNAVGARKSECVVCIVHFIVQTVTPVTSIEHLPRPSHDPSCSCSTRARSHRRRAIASCTLGTGYRPLDTAAVPRAAAAIALADAKPPAVTPPPPVLPPPTLLRRLTLLLRDASLSRALPTPRGWLPSTAATRPLWLPWLVALVGLAAADDTLEPAPLPYPVDTGPKAAPPMEWRARVWSLRLLPLPTLLPRVWTRGGGGRTASVCTEDPQGCPHNVHTHTHLTPDSVHAHTGTHKPNEQQTTDTQQ